MLSLRKGSAALKVWTLALASALPGTANAQTTPGSNKRLPDDIVVQASRSSDDERRAEAAEFIRRTGVTPRDRPIARWIDPICPHILGLSASHAQIVEARIRSIASASGAAVARPGCRTNIAVSFTQDAPSLVRAIVTKSARSLAEVPADRRTALLREQLPIRWWYATQFRQRDGAPGMAAMPIWAGGAEGGGSILPDIPNAANQTQYSSSRISTQTHRALVGATIIVDVDRAEGTSLSAVADYVAMVALAEIQPVSSIGRSSILDLFGGGPSAMTARDRTFLDALYRLPLDRNGRQHRRQLVSAMTNPPD